MKYVIAAIAFTCLYSPAFSHTCDPEKVKCPLDSTEVEFCVTMSMTTFGSYLDFQKQGAIGNHYEELINSCPKCHYAGFLSDFDTTFTAERSKEIRQFLAKFNNLTIDNALECQIAGELKELLHAENDDVSNCYLIGSYLIRSDSTQIDRRKDLQTKTKTYLLKAIEAGEYKDPGIMATINYLIAEMCRRTGEFEAAVTYFDKAIADPNKKDWIEEIAVQQKELALKRDSNNEI